MLGVRSYYVERNYHNCVGGESWKLSFRVNFIGLIWIVTLPYIWQVCLLNEHYCKIYYAYFQLQIWRHDFWKRKQGWRSDKSTRLPPMWPGFDSRTRRYMWVEFAVGSRPCSEWFFSRYSGFPLSSITNISKFQFHLESEGHRFVSRNRLLSVTLIKQSRLIDWLIDWLIDHQAYL